MTAQSITAPRFEPCELATEMSSLSLSDQAEALNELFGRDTAAVKDEDPAVIKEALQALFQEISCIKDKSAFRQALQQCPAGYAQSDQFCLMFLRAERFDASRAAQRVVKYWEEKLKLFGPRKAFRRLTIHDLEPKDVETLREGGIRMLPGRDASGRGLLYIDRTKWNRDRDSMLRILWYMVHSSLEDVDVQKSGLVLVEVSQKLFTLKHFDRKLNNFIVNHCRHILPIRICGSHLLIESSLVQLVLPFMLHAMGKEQRARFRTHAQSNGLLGELEDYGIAAIQIPLEFGGMLDQNDLDAAWVAHRRLKEANPMDTRSRTPPRTGRLLRHPPQARAA